MENFLLMSLRRSSSSVIFFQNFIRMVDKRLLLVSGKFVQARVDEVMTEVDNRQGLLSTVSFLQRHFGRQNYTTAESYYLK